MYRHHRPQLPNVSAMIRQQVAEIRRVCQFLLSVLRQAENVEAAREMAQQVSGLLEKGSPVVDDFHQNQLLLQRLSGLANDVVASLGGTPPPTSVASSSSSFSALPAPLPLSATTTLSSPLSGLSLGPRLEEAAMAEKQAELEDDPMDVDILN
jgi:hypothetical protein